MIKKRLISLRQDFSFSDDLASLIPPNSSLDEIKDIAEKHENEIAISYFVAFGFFQLLANTPSLVFFAAMTMGAIDVTYRHHVLEKIKKHHKKECRRNAQCLRSSWTLRNDDGSPAIWSDIMQERREDAVKTISARKILLIEDNLPDLNI